MRTADMPEGWVFAMGKQLVAELRAGYAASDVSFDDSLKALVDTMVTTKTLIDRVAAVEPGRVDTFALGSDKPEFPRRWWFCVEQGDDFCLVLAGTKAEVDKHFAEATAEEVEPS